MNADYFSKTGANQTACQDYALGGVENNVAYAIICDGESSRPDCELGRRILALTAKTKIFDFDFSALSYQTFGRRTIKQADSISCVIPCLDPAFLDATLLVAGVKHEKLVALLYGDGIFLHKTASSVRAVHVSTVAKGKTEPLPDYLSYHLDSLRKERYDELQAEKVINDFLIQATGNSGGTIFKKTFEPVIIEATAAPGDIVAICSKGMDSFHNRTGAVAWPELVGDYLNFKEHEGNFVQQAMETFLQKCGKETIHEDDISIAAIAV